MSNPFFPLSSPASSDWTPSNSSPCTPTGDGGPPILHSSPERCGRVVAVGNHGRDVSSRKPAVLVQTASKMQADTRSPLAALQEQVIANANANANVQASQRRNHRASRSSSHRNSKRDDLMKTALTNNAAQKGLSFNGAAIASRKLLSPVHLRQAPDTAWGASAVGPQRGISREYEGWAAKNICRPTSSIYSQENMSRSTSSSSKYSKTSFSTAGPLEPGLTGLTNFAPDDAHKIRRQDYQTPSTGFVSQFGWSPKSPSHSSPNSIYSLKGADAIGPSLKDSQIIKQPPLLKLRYDSNVYQQDKQNYFYSQQSPTTEIEDQIEETIVSIPRNQAILTDRKHMSQGWWDILGQPFSMDEKELQKLVQMMPKEDAMQISGRQNTADNAVTSEPGYVGGSVKFDGLNGGFTSSMRNEEVEHKVSISPTTEIHQKEDTTIAPVTTNLPAGSSPTHLDSPQPNQVPLHIRRGLEISHIHTFPDQPRFKAKRPVRKVSTTKEKERRPSNNITIQTVNIITSGLGGKGQPTIQSISPVVNAVFVQSPRVQNDKPRQPLNDTNARVSIAEDENNMKPTTVPARVDNPVDTRPTPAARLEPQTHQRHHAEQGQGSSQQQGGSHNATVSKARAAARDRGVAIDTPEDVTERVENHLPPYSPTDPRFDPVAAAAYLASTARQTEDNLRDNGNGASLSVNTSSNIHRPENREGSLLTVPSQRRGNKSPSSRPPSIDVFKGTSSPQSKSGQRSDRDDTESIEPEITPWPDHTFFNGERTAGLKQSASVSRKDKEPAIDRRTTKDSRSQYGSVNTQWDFSRKKSVSDDGSRYTRDTRYLSSNIGHNHFSTNTRFTDQIHSDRNHLQQLYSPLSLPFTEEANSIRRKDSSTSTEGGSGIQHSSKMNNTTSNVETVTTTTTNIQKPARNGGLCGCFSTNSQKKKSRRPWFWALLVILILLIVAASILPPVLYHTIGPGRSRWVHPDNFPALPTGISTVAGTNLTQSRNSCIAPSTLWSCSLPKEDQNNNMGFKSTRPSFTISIKYQDPNNTKTSDNQAVGLDNFVSWPDVPGLKDMEFMGNTTDGVQGPNYAGEETPFWVTLVSQSSSTVPSSIPARLMKRDTRNSTVAIKSGKDKGKPINGTDTGGDDDPLIKANMTSPNPDVFIPRPQSASDGTALPAQLYPLVENQPLRLYNRGSEDEYYGFYTYFDRRIFIAGVSSSENDTEVADQNGGSTKEEAKAACIWGSTRFFVQMWTSETSTRRHLLGGGAPAGELKGTDAFSMSSGSATYDRQPGSFPYPVTITLDRHGGVTHDKMVYCYGLDGDKKYILDENRIVDEDRGKGGKLINAAPDLYLERSNKKQRDIMPQEEEGKTVGDSIDGGTGGCICQYKNWN